MSEHDFKLTPEDSERVQQIKLALEQELRESPSSNHHKSTIKDIEDLKEDALVALRHTIKHSQNESLKTKVSMWAIDKLLDTSRTADDPIMTFLEGMNASATHSS